MKSKTLKCLWAIVKTVLMALYLFVFYQLILVPAILDWSSFGILLTLALSLLLIWSIPPARRLSTTVLGITFLLALKSLDNIREYPALHYVLGALLIFLLLLFTGKLLGRFTFRRYLVVFLVALILTSSLDLSEAPFWTEFRVKWESPLLYKTLATVDYFPIKLMDVDGDHIKEIVTQENLAQADQETQEIAQKGKQYQILQPENNHYAVYKWDGNTFKEIPPSRYDLRKLEAALPMDYIGYPFYGMSLSVNSKQGIEQQMTPLVDRSQLIAQAMNFGSFPFRVLSLSEKSLKTRLQAKSVIGQPQQPQPLGQGKLLPGPGTETVSIDGSLKVRTTDPSHKIVGMVDNTQISDIGTSEVLLGDVNNDQRDDLMLTSETSHILELNPDGRWQILWTSPEPVSVKNRFSKFRFEDFAPLGRDKTPQLIALSKSNVRDNPTRYMTGYVYQNGTLHQKWRVFTGLINLRAGDVDGDGANELVGYMYRAQRIFVLEKHDLPVVPALYTLTGALILLGFGLQLRQKRKTANGGEQNA